MWHFLNDAVRAAIAFAGDIASLLSLVLTLLVYFNVRKLRRAYLFTARVPELTEELDSSRACAAACHKRGIEESTSGRVGRN
jgi:hypothetical protein